jgi:hypothetical protein
MKRFLLFVGSRCYPSGGWNDFQGGYDTKDEVIAAGIALVEEYADPLIEWWFHVIDMETGEQVHEHYT